MSACAIREPRWCQPAMIAVGGSFAIAVDAPPDNPQASLRRDGCEVRLELGEFEPSGREGVALATAQAPADCPDGLWDLALGAAVQPHAVAVGPPAAEVTLAFTGDWHIQPPSAPEPDTKLLHRSEALVDELNALAPDVVLHLGDVITRYLPDKQPKPAAHIRWQMEAAREVMSRIEAPLFVLPGNHELAYDRCRRPWWKLFGKPWRSATDDCQRLLGPCQVIILDGFCFYDRASLQITDQSPTDEQVAWLEAQCRERPAPHRLLVTHYDYGQVILPRLDELGIDALVYGHGGREDDKWFADNPCQNGHVPGNLAYRLAHAGPDSLVFDEPVAFDDMTAARAANEQSPDGSTNDSA